TRASSYCSANCKMQHKNGATQNVLDPLVEEAEHEDQKLNCKFENVEAIFDHLGGTGRYNLLVLVIMVYVNLFPGMITLSANFTAADVPFNCSKFGFENSSLSSTCAPSTSIDDNLQCRVTLNCTESAGLNGQLDNSMSSVLKTFECQSFQFSTTGALQETAVSRFGLVCQRAWMSNLATTFFFIGFLFGCSLYGALADRFGRLRMMLIALCNMSVGAIAASQAPFLWLYWCFQLLIGIGIGGFMSCTFSFALENTDPAHRSISGFNLHNGWTVGIFLGTFIAYFERRYSRLLLYKGLCAAAALPPLLILSESPRWLVSARRFKQADSVLHRIARINRRSLGGDAFSSEAISRRFEKRVVKTSVLDLLRRPGMRRVTFIAWAMFFNVSMAYYGISLGIGDLGGSIFVNQLLAAAVEIPARLLGMLASYRIGRRVSTMVSFGLAGICLTATAFLFGDSRYTGARIATAMTGKFWITLAFDLAWLYSAEVFPTVVRSLGVGTGSTFARVGAMVSTLVPGLGFVWRPLPFLILAAGPLLVVLLAVAAPETKGRRLPDSMEDGERLAQAGGCCGRRQEDSGRGDIEL
ncbi:hypothetical protein BOX15_Mlig002548g3, partial [Macrostomum lignano]